jgi:UDP-N-acetylglucosamine 4,6-dehydratase (inverting)
MLTDKTVLITGGTGSFGKKFTEIVLREHRPRKLIVFSRDELKQYEMQEAGWSVQNYPALRFFIGDVRDKERLLRAFQGVDIVIHAAALKQVPTCEYNPIEAVATNVDGAKNIINAALDMGVGKVLALSTDKAVNPANLYGATKQVAEKLFVQANAYSGLGPTRFACVRYGNVVGSRGSVVPLFLRQRETGRVTITDPRMTRFWITLEQGVRFVLRSIERMHGGEVFVPKIPSTNILDLAEAIAPGCVREIIGIRPGEKLHEVLVSEDEARSALEFDDSFVIQPEHPFWSLRDTNHTDGRPCPDGYRYSSDANPQVLSIPDIRALTGVH